MALLLIQFDGTIWMLVVLLAIGWAVTYISARRMLSRTVADLRRELDERVSSLLLSIKAAEAQALEAGKTSATAAAPAQSPPKPESAPVPQPSTSGAQSISAPTEEHQEVSPEVLLVIAAAVTAFLGKKVKIRSAKMLQTPYEIVNPWVQQGRVVVQASHNLSPRGH